MIGAKDVVLQSILDNMPVLFYRIDADDYLIDTAGSGFSALELDPQNLSGSHLSDVFEPISQKLKSIRLLGRYFCETSHQVASKRVWLFHYLFKDHGKHCAARFNRQFVELSEIESARMGEFKRLSVKAPIAPRDYT